MQNKRNIYVMKESHLLKKLNSVRIHPPQDFILSYRIDLALPPPEVEEGKELCGMISFAQGNEAHWRLHVSAVADCCSSTVHIIELSTWVSSS